jgi:hypothetical protein
LAGEGRCLPAAPCGGMASRKRTVKRLTTMGL